VVVKAAIMICQLDVSRGLVGCLSPSWITKRTKFKATDGSSVKFQLFTLHTDSSSHNKALYAMNAMNVLARGVGSKTDPSSSCAIAY
jgi:hypothetical protein